MILLDYIILVAVTSYSATQYLKVVLGAAGATGPDELVLSLRDHRLRRHPQHPRLLQDPRRTGSPPWSWPTSALQALIIVLGLVAFFHLDTITDTIHLGDTPTWGDTVFALGVATVSFTGLESASGLSGEVAVGPARAQAPRRRRRDGHRHRRLHRHRDRGRHGARSAATRPRCGRNYLDAPMIGIAESFHTDCAGAHAEVHDRGGGAATLIAAANSAMMGLSRLAYSLSTNRQIPSAVGRLHSTRSTPFVVIIHRRRCSPRG